MGDRGDRERVIAEIELQRAAAEHALAAGAPDDELRTVHEQSAYLHEEAARLRASLAAFYDSEDAI